jgi:hypothetical protein
MTGLGLKPNQAIMQLIMVMDKPNFLPDNSTQKA